MAKAGNGIEALKRYLAEARGIAVQAEAEEGEVDPEVGETISKIEALGTKLRAAINRAMTRT